jgi:very-short-patch-repair endonuclease
VAATGVYRVAAVPVGWESVLLAHVLGAGPGAVASHRSAAVLWGLDGVRRGAPELTTTRYRHYVVPPGVRVHRSADLSLVTPAMRDRIPVTPVDRTLLDLGAVVPPGVLHLAVDDARRRGLVDWDALIDVLVRHARRGRRGAGPLRALLEAHAAEVVATGSGFERMVISALLSAGLPPPVLQHEVVVGDRRFRIDLAYPPRRLGIELDGGDHLRRHVWEADHERQNALVLAGWTILRFTWRDYRWRRPALVAEVRRALAMAA